MAKFVDLREKAIKRREEEALRKEKRQEFVREFIKAFAAFRKLDADEILAIIRTINTTAVIQTQEIAIKNSSAVPAFLEKILDINYRFGEDAQKTVEYAAHAVALIGTSDAINGLSLPEWLKKIDEETARLAEKMKQEQKDLETPPGV